jgi:hypothetical protein
VQSLADEEEQGFDPEEEKGLEKPQEEVQGNSHTLFHVSLHHSLLCIDIKIKQRKKKEVNRKARLCLLIRQSTRSGKRGKKVKCIT